MPKKLLALLIIISGLGITSTQTVAQLVISGEYRPRAEYRHGFNSLPNSDQDPAFFIDQRSRLNLHYLTDKYEVKFVLQDVRTWGSEPQLTAADGDKTTMHEAWGKVNLSESLALKLGRQEINLDDQRIFGAVGWAQQARSHDAALLLYKKSDVQINLGLAYNQDGPQNTTNFYTVPNSYKTFQYLWANKAFKDLNVSALFLNNGVQGGTSNNPDTYFSQTFGTRVSYTGDPLLINVAAYKQTGAERDGVSDINASYIAADITYSITASTSLLAGLELLSGNAPSNPNGENNAFNPFYGTNHKFNGLMDYFYVGNHIGNVGLQDFFVGFKQKFGNTTANLTTHLFYAAENIINLSTGSEADKYLGTEVDLVWVFPISSDIKINTGYSQMFGSNSMELLKGGNKNETSNWAWMMLTIKPTFFTTKKDDNHAN